MRVAMRLATLQDRVVTSQIIHANQRIKAQSRLTRLVQTWPRYGPQVDRSLWLTTKEPSRRFSLFSSPRRTVLSGELRNLELANGFPRHVIVMVMVAVGNS